MFYLKFVLKSKNIVNLTILSKENSQMKIESFGEYIRYLREGKKLPLRKVAAHLDIDTSTLSKVEKGDRPISIGYLKPLSTILEVNLKDLQVKFVADAINNRPLFFKLCERISKTACFFCATGGVVFRIEKENDNFSFQRF